MQSIGTDDLDSQIANELVRTIVIGRLEDLPLGSRKTVELPNEREIALYNIDGEFYATTTPRGLPARGPRHRELLSS
jgi:hypothetical protein